MSLSFRLSAFLSGLTFGLGLLISGFYNPNNVLAFFNIFGNWKAGLIITFAISIGISGVAFRLIKNRSESIIGYNINLPQSKLIDKKLLLGALLFGIGWGLIGICPGPALVLLGSFKIESVYFFIGFIPGIFLVKMFKF